MNAKNEKTVYAVSVKDSAALLRSFSVSAPGFQDAENQCSGVYLLLTGRGQGSDFSASIRPEDTGAFCSDLIRVAAVGCMLYRIVEEKVSGFIAVVRQSWRTAKRKLCAHFHRSRILPRKVPPGNSITPAKAGVLRL